MRRRNAGDGVYIRGGWDFKYDPSLCAAEGALNEGESAFEVKRRNRRRTNNGYRRTIGKKAVNKFREDCPGERESKPYGRKK